MHPTSNNIGAYITTKLAYDAKAFGAGSGITAQDGNSFDRTAVRPLHLSGKLSFPSKVTLASGHTASFAYGVQDSANGSDWADVEGASGSTSFTSISSSAVRYSPELDVNLVGLRQYVRPRLNVAMSHSGTDVISVAGVWALGGGEDLPPTEVAN